jgi:hypothetical protein
MNTNNDEQNVRREITPSMVTKDGYSYRILATDLKGPNPIAIYVEDLNGIFRLDNDLQCADNDGVSLAEPKREFTKFVNVYRNRDGAFTVGKSTYNTDADRRRKRDSERALFGLKLTINETTMSATAELIAR